MMENPFEAQVADLIAGNLAEIVVEPKDFMLFREVWKEQPNRVRIIGEAGLNGRVVYRYQTLENEAL